jgi:hypothetical protein
VPPSNPVTLEPTPAPRLPAAAAVSSDPLPPEAISRAVGGEQGVTSDALNASSVNLAFRSLCSQKGENGDEKTSPDKAPEPDDGDEAVLRVLGVTARVTDAEYAQLKADAKRRHKRMGALLREAYFDSSTAIIVPEPYQKKWAELSRPLSNLNQIAAHLNEGKVPTDFGPLLVKLSAQIQSLRAKLIGQKGRL